MLSYIQQKVIEDTTAAQPADHTYGAVFVHGIGSQPQSSALRENAEPLVRWLRSWHRENGIPGFGVAWSMLSYGEDISGPARIGVHIPAVPGSADQTSQNWVLTEGWWAARLSAPSFGKMVVWSLRVAWRAVVRLIVSSQTEHPVVGYSDRVKGRDTQIWPRSRLARSIEWFSGRALTATYFAALLLLTPFTVVLFLVAQLPIPGVEQFVLLKLLRPLLLDGVGDFYTYLHDEIQSMHMRRSVQEAVAWLVEKERCEGVVVVAHSGGTVLAFDALGTRDPAGCLHDTPALREVNGLMTFGSALNAAWYPDLGPTPAVRLRDRLCPHTYWLDMWAAFDYVAGGPIEKPHGEFAHPMPDESIKVTNGLSVALDHGGYFDNEEEHLSRLAEFIESPGDRHQSRFWKKERDLWVKKRQDRVTTLVGWRQWAWAASSIAIGYRLFTGSLRADGVAIVGAMHGLPFIGGVTDVIDAVLAAIPDPLKAAANVWLGLFAWIAVCVLLYVAVVRVVFETWAARDGRDSIRPKRAPASQKAEIFVRTLPVLAALSAVAYGIAVFGTIELTFWNWVAVAIGFGIWWTAWVLLGGRGGQQDKPPAAEATPVPATTTP